MSKKARIVVKDARKKRSNAAGRIESSVISKGIGEAHNKNLAAAAVEQNGTF